MAPLPQGLLEQFGPSIVLGGDCGSESRALPLGWAELDSILPDRGLPRGVTELRAQHGLGGGTSIALTAMRAAQLRDERAWCAWLDPEGSLYAPGIAMAGVDLNRLALVRPPRQELLRIAVKVVRSRAFEVVAIDIDPLPGASPRREAKPAPRARSRGATLEVCVRKLALLSTEVGTTVLLLTDARVARPAPLPVALRLELARTETAVCISVGKERHGRISLAKTVPLQSRPALELTG